MKTTTKGDTAMVDPAKVSVSRVPVKTGNTMSRDELFGDYVAMLEHARQCARRIPLNGEETSPDQADEIVRFWEEENHGRLSIRIYDEQVEDQLSTTEYAEYRDLVMRELSAEISSKIS